MRDIVTNTRRAGDHGSTASHPRPLTAELVPRLHDGPVARDVGLGAERVVGLAAAQRAGDAVHGERRGPLVPELLHQVRVLGGVEEGDEGAVAELGRLVRGGGAQLGGAMEALEGSDSDDQIGRASGAAG